MLSPVLKEPPETKGHQLQKRLEHEDDGEHVVAVLEGFIQGLKREIPVRPAQLGWPSCPFLDPHGGSGREQGERSTEISEIES